MKRIILWLSLAIALQITLSVPAKTNETLRVMSFNVLYANPNPPNSWPERRPMLRDCVRSVAPDILGVQEPPFLQLQDIAADLPEFDWIGVGTEGGSRGAINAVFFRTTRLTPLAYDCFWLSDTPDLIGSKTWGAKYSRTATWVKFEDRRTKQQFCFVNTHFDHVSEEAREHSAHLLRHRLQQFKDSLPIIMVGDFNTSDRSRAFQVLSSNGFFVDAFAVCEQWRGPKFDTFHGFKPAASTGTRIDWILLSRTVRCKTVEVVVFCQNGHYPSDHFPVAAWIDLP